MKPFISLANTNSIYTYVKHIPLTTSGIFVFKQQIKIGGACSLSTYYLDKTSLTRLVHNVNEKFIADISSSEDTLVLTRGNGSTETVSLDIYTGSDVPEASLNVIDDIIEGMN